MCYYIHTDTTLIIIQGVFEMLLRRKNAAKHLGISISKFDTMRNKGILPAPVGMDGSVLWDNKDLDKYIEDNKLESTLEG